MSIEYIDIVHHIHTDLGYTDHPLRAREIQAKFVGQAVEYVLETAEKKDPFTWTCETLLGVSDWLKQADAAQREHFYRAVDTGNLEITALPFNVTPFLNEQQWDQLLHWMPDAFWSRVPIRAAMQNDINGLPSAGISKLLGRGVHYLWMGPNVHLAASPFLTPHAFRWRMPNGNSMFVWLNGHYNNGFYLFNEFWREGPIPNTNDTRYRWPDGNDIFRTDDESLEHAHEQCAKCMAAFEGREPNAGQFVRDGFIFNKINGIYPYRTLCVSITNHWRMDNDPPMKHLQSFVEKWNAHGYFPHLRLTTATQAMRHIEQEAGDSLDVVEGEWPDWWANGTMSVPRELSCARQAKRLWSTALSPVYGNITDEDRSCAEKVMKQLCLFDEHTYSSWKSVGSPYDLEVLSAQAEVSVLAYRSLESVKNLISDRFRRLPEVREQGVYLANPMDNVFQGWVTIPKNCLRGNYTHLLDESAGIRYPLHFISSKGGYDRPKSMAEMSEEYETTDFTDRAPGAAVRFWLPELKAKSVLRLIACSGDEREANAPGKADIRCDEAGWPTQICYPQRGAPMFQPGFGTFMSVSTDALAPRWAMMDVFHAETDAERKRLREQVLHEIKAEYGSTTRTESEHDITFTQGFTHPSLRWAKRILTISKSDARGRLTIRMRRKDDAAPEIYYLRMKMANTKTLPVMSAVGREYRPGVGQIPNSCMDYYACDGWVRYEDAQSSWLISSLDAPMLTFGQPNCFARLKKIPDDTDTAFFMLFDNTWDTNFPANEHGLLEYQFDLLQTDRQKLGQKEADAMAFEPQVLVNVRNQPGFQP